MTRRRARECRLRNFGLRTSRMSSVCPSSAKRWAPSSEPLSSCGSDYVSPPAIRCCWRRSRPDPKTMGAGVQAILSNSKSASSHKLSSPKSPADAPGASANNTSQAKAFAFSREDSYYAREQEPEILEREKKIREEKSRTFGKQARGPPCTLPKLASRAERAGAARSGWELLVRAPGTAPTASGQRRGLAHNVHRPIPELSADNGGIARLHPD